VTKLSSQTSSRLFLGAELCRFFGNMNFIDSIFSAIADKHLADLEEAINLTLYIGSLLLKRGVFLRLFHIFYLLHLQYSNATL